MISSLPWMQLRTAKKRMAVPPAGWNLKSILRSLPPKMHSVRDLRVIREQSDDAPHG